MMGDWVKKGLDQYGHLRPHSLPVFVCLEGMIEVLSSLVGNWAILDIDWLIPSIVVVS
jgi:hypothetical protein